jgi:hypothetical protein
MTRNADADAGGPQTRRQWQPPTDDDLRLMDELQHRVTDAMIKARDDGLDLKLALGVLERLAGNFVLQAKAVGKIK